MNDCKDFKIGDRVIVKNGIATFGIGEIIDTFPINNCYCIKLDSGIDCYATKYQLEKLPKLPKTPIPNELYSSIGESINIRQIVEENRKKAQEIIKNISNKEENKMNNANEILNLWYERKRKAINKGYESQITELEQNDLFYVDVKNLINSNNNIYKFDENTLKSVFEMQSDFIAQYDFYTEDTKNKIKNIRTQLYEKQENLKTLKQEIEIQLKRCETYDQQTNIFKIYGVYTDSGKISE